MTILSPTHPLFISKSLSIHCRSSYNMETTNWLRPQLHSGSIPSRVKADEVDHDASPFRGEGYLGRKKKIDHPPFPCKAFCLSFCP